jgi:hypothetical protein
MCIPLSLYVLKLAMLRPSSSVTEGGVLPNSLTPSAPFANLAAFCCCSSNVILSVSSSATMFSVAVGSSARTVYVQSS